MLHSDFKMLIRANHTHLVHCYTLVTQTLILVVKVGAVTHYRRDGGVLLHDTTRHDVAAPGRHQHVYVDRATWSDMCCVIIQGIGSL